MTNNSCSAIYMLAIKGNASGRWIPIYQPCFTLEEAKKKQKTKKYTKTTIVRYVPDTYWDSEANVSE